MSRNGDEPVLSNSLSQNDFHYRNKNKSGTSRLQVIRNSSSLLINVTMPIFFISVRPLFSAIFVIMLTPPMRNLGFNCLYMI